MYNSISKRECSINLAMGNPGYLNHSRCIATTNRILRLYSSEIEPLEDLKTLVMIICVYAPTWLAVKAHWSCKDGSRPLHIKSRYLSHKHKKIADPFIHRNAYFTHPKNLLLVMMTDHIKHIRKMDLRRMMRARAEEDPSGVKT